MDVILGGKLICSATNTYVHCSISEVLLNYDKEAAEVQLGCGLFCKDTARQMEEMDISADPVLNTDLETRNTWTKTSKIVDLQGRIHSDVFNQEKLILNRVDLTLNFVVTRLNSVCSVWIQLQPIRLPSWTPYSM